MKCANVTGAAVTDLGTVLPFVPNNKVVAINIGTNADTLQFGAAAAGPFTTAAVVPAGTAVEVEITGRYAAIENGSGFFVLLAN